MYDLIFTQADTIPQRAINSVVSTHFHNIASNKAVNQKLRKFLVVLGAILSILGFANFIYSHGYRSLANGIGFALISYGNYKATPDNKFGMPTLAIGLGLIICITTMVLDFFK